MNELKFKLGLKPTRVEALNLNTFGSESYERRQCDLAKLTLLGRDGTSIEIQAISFPKICSPVTARIDVAQLTKLQNFELADYDPNRSSGKIDVLIGSDYYWDVVSGDVVREGTGPVAIRSIFGWILSGKIKCRRNIQNLIISNLVLQGPDEISIRKNGDNKISEELK